MPTFSPQQILAIVLGLALLIFGRRVYWLALGGAGAFLGLALANHALPYLQLSSPVWETVTIAFCAVLGVVAAFTVQKIAVVFGGAILGGLTVAWTLDYLRPAIEEPLQIGLLLGGGLLGALFAASVFKIALIFVSALIGARLLVDVLALEGLLGLGAFVLLTLVGITLQSGPDDKK